MPRLWHCVVRNTRLVMLAKQRGVISAARPVIAALKQHGMFLSEKTIDRAMALVGEV